MCCSSSFLLLGNALPVEFCTYRYDGPRVPRSPFWAITLAVELLLGTGVSSRVIQNLSTFHTVSVWSYSFVLNMEPTGKPLLRIVVFLKQKNSLLSIYTFDINHGKPVGQGNDYLVGCVTLPFSCCLHYGWGGLPTWAQWDNREMPWL